MTIYFSIASLVISIISITIAIISFRRTKIFQDYEYMPRLQLLDEKVVGGTPSGKNSPALTYNAKVENRGLKPIKIDSLNMDYGDKTDQRKRVSRHIEGEIFVSPGQCHPVSVIVTWDDVDEMKKRFNINDCHFTLKTLYHSPDGEVKISLRPLIGFTGPSSIVSHVPKGNCLT